MKNLFKIIGVVINGAARGKRLGFPTANLHIENKNIPEGIYASQIKIRGEIYNSITFIGAAKTFNAKNIQAETYIYDFSKDIYGEKVEVYLLSKIRNNKKFNTAKELILQMKKDNSKVIKYFSQHTQ